MLSLGELARRRCMPIGWLRPARVAARVAWAEGWRTGASSWNRAYGAPRPGLDGEASPPSAGLSTTGPYTPTQPIKMSAIELLNPRAGKLSHLDKLTGLYCDSSADLLPPSIPHPISIYRPTRNYKLFVENVRRAQAFQINVTGAMGLANVVKSNLGQLLGHDWTGWSGLGLSAT